MPTFELETPQGGKFQIDAADMTNALKAFDHMQKNGGTAQPSATEAPPETSTLGDIAKSGGIGLARGAIGLSGLPGDAADLATKGLNWAFGSNIQNKVPLPTSGGIQGAIEAHTGKFYEPQTGLGHVAQTIGEFAPGLAMPAGEAGIAGRALRNVVAPALGSEAAGKLTEGTAAQPYAQVLGALAGGVAGAKTGMTPKPSMTLEDVGARARQLYNSPAVTDARFDPAWVKSASDQMKGALRQQRFNDTTAPGTFGILEDLKEPVGPMQGNTLGAPLNPPVKAAVALGQQVPLHSYEDFQAARTQLGKLAGNFNNPVEQAAASKAISLLDQHINNIPQSAVRVGDPQALANTLAQARQEYSVFKTGQRIQEKLRNAELQAASANSGQNAANATRQKLRTLLTSQKNMRGIPDDVADAIESSVRGSPTANALRTVANYAKGPGGHLASMGTFLESGNPLALAIPLAGTALKKAATKVELRKANNIVNQLMQRSPSYAAHVASLPPIPASARGILPYQAVMRAALLGPRTPVSQENQ